MPYPSYVHTHTHTHKLCIYQGEELVIMPYPNYGAHCMAVNDGEGQENCQYTGVTYRGFPYIFLIATANIKEGTELLTSYGDDYFKNRGHCECRIPGERERERERARARARVIVYAGRLVFGVCNVSVCVHACVCV